MSNDFERHDVLRALPHLTKWTIYQSNLNLKFVYLWNLKNIFSCDGCIENLSYIKMVYLTFLETLLAITTQKSQLQCMHKPIQNALWLFVCVGSHLFCPSQTVDSVSILSQIYLKSINNGTDFAALAHGSQEERMLQRDVETSTRDANI